MILLIVFRCVGMACVAMGLCGCLWFCMTTTFLQMTANDCQAGVQAACEALKQ